MTRSLINVFFSAWLLKEKTCNYLENRETFRVKNKSKIFKLAIQQIELAINSPLGPITLKGVPIGELLSTFREHEKWLRAIFMERRNKMDHLNKGNGYDFITVLYRVLEGNDQKRMYECIRDCFAENYYDNPNVRYI